MLPRSNKMRAIIFDPQLGLKTQPRLSKAYPIQEDRAAEVAGARIAQGDYSPDRFKTIFEWKTNGRGLIAGDRALGSSTLNEPDLVLSLPAKATDETMACDMIHDGMSYAAAAEKIGAAGRKRAA